MKNDLRDFLRELWNWMKGLLTIRDPLNNLSLKLISLAIAIGLWLVINNNHDPVVSRQFSDIQVRLLHTESLAGEDRICTILNDSDVVQTVTVSAKRSVADSLSADNIVATADLNNVSPDGEIPISFSVNRYSDSVESVRGSSDTVHVSIEDKQSATFMLETDTTGTVAEGYLLNSVTVDQNQVRVTGPRSVVEQISRAAVLLDVNDAAGNINTYLDIRLYDGDGQEISMNSNLTANIEKVMVRAEILPTKSVRLSCIITGTPEAGYQVTGDIEMIPGTITIAAKRAVLEEIDVIEIPSDQLNINGLKSSLTRVIDTNSLLPEGVVLADPETDGRIRIRVEIKKGPELENPSDSGGEKGDKKEKDKEKSD